MITTIINIGPSIITYGGVIFVSNFNNGAISRSNQCSMTGVAKAVVCVIMSVG